jgi:hypothetical protein
MLRKVWFPCGARNPHVVYEIQQERLRSGRGGLGACPPRFGFQEAAGSGILCEGAPGPLKCLLLLRHGSVW